MYIMLDQYLNSHIHTCMTLYILCVHTLLCSSISGLKRGQSEVLHSPSVKKRRINTHYDSRTGEKEEEERDSLPSNQQNLFNGLSFLLTHRTKEDKHLGIHVYMCLHVIYMLFLFITTLYVIINFIYLLATATPPCELIDKEQVVSRIHSRMGRILENTDHMVSLHSIPILTSIPFLCVTQFYVTILTQAECGECYVISDGYCRTKKYMMGLAMGLHCISYGWINECIDKVYIQSNSSRIGGDNLTLVCPFLSLSPSCSISPPLTSLPFSPPPPPPPLSLSLSSPSTGCVS